MNKTLIKRLAALERKTKHVSAGPDLIMIHYEDSKGKWIVVEHYIVGDGKKPENFKQKGIELDRLQDYHFLEYYRSRVILNTFGSPDPTIHGNLFCFDAKDLRADLKKGDDSAVYIESITAPEGRSIKAELTIGKV